MIFQEIGLKGAFLVHPEKCNDERGCLARTWCAQEFARQGLIANLAQASISFNAKKGTLRGMHFQVPPSREAKLVRCTMGVIWDVIIDLRPASPSFLQHYAMELSSQNHLALYIPPGFAHGFQTLTADTEVFYQMTDFYEPRLARGVRWNDPAFGIQWPNDQRTLIERDNTYPDFGAHIQQELASFLYP